MVSKETQDIVIIGSGPGGYVAAIHAAHLGAKVSLVEKDATLGGTCLNRGCIPTKALVRSAEVMLDAQRSSHFGIDIDNAKINLPRVMARKRDVVNKLVNGIDQLMKANKINVYKGTGHISSSNLVKVNDEDIPTKKVVIATGSEKTLLPVSGLDLPGMLTTDDILELEKLPKSLVVIGGSHVGTELACVFSAFGTKVTIVKRRPLRLEPVDEEIGRRFAQLLPRQGIEVITDAPVKAIKKGEEGLQAVWDTPEGEEKWIEGEMILMATGRKPYIAGLGIEDTGIKMKGPAVMVNERLETNIKGIYAIGDVLGKHMLAHVASYEGEIAVGNALGHTRRAEYHAVPTVIFTYPEIAGVGITETEAKEKKIPHRVSKFPFMATGRAVAMDKTMGMVKLICNSADGKVLGMHIMGPHAGDLIAEGAIAVQNGLTAKELAHTMHAHPTLPEAVLETAMGQLEGAIHLQRM